MFNNAISGEKSCLISLPFLLTYVEIRTIAFSRLLNADWSIEISGESALCKANTSSSSDVESLQSVEKGEDSFNSIVQPYQVEDEENGICFLTLES